MKRRPTLEHISEQQRDPQVRDELQRNLLGQANHSLLGWLRKGSMVAQQREALQKALLADDSADVPVRPGSLPGDPVRLRGIPAIGGRGSIGGAIAGTNPGDSFAGRRGQQILREIRQRARERNTPHHVDGDDSAADRAGDDPLPSERDAGPEP